VNGGLRTFIGSLKAGRRIGRLKEVGRASLYLPWSREYKYKNGGNFDYLIMFISYFQPFHTDYCLLLTSIMYTKINPDQINISN